MNAWTGTPNVPMGMIECVIVCGAGPDYTSYPFSTVNEKDFRNLMAVYLDAAYFPKLDKFDFMQEVMLSDVVLI